MTTSDGSKRLISTIMDVSKTYCIAYIVQFKKKLFKLLNLDRNNIQKAGVQYILDSVVDELMKNPDRR